MDTKSIHEMSEMQSLQLSVHETAVKRGWWDKERSFGDLIALVHSELSEALEAYREMRWGKEVVVQARDNFQPDCVQAELADVAIRLFDMCEKYGIDLEYWIEWKNDYNQSRAYRHGGKVL